MPPLPVVTGRECVRALEKVGFVVERRRGSHIVMRRDAPALTISVPDHRPLAPGTLRNIIRTAGLTVQEFTDLL